MDEKRRVHLPTRETFRSILRKSVLQKMYLESWSGDNIFLLIVCFCNNEVVKPVRVVVI